MRYLVVEKNMQLQNEKNLPMETLLQNLDSILRVLPAGNYDLETQHETINEPENSDRASYEDTSTPALMGGNSESERTNILGRNDSSGMSPNNEVGTILIFSDRYSYDNISQSFVASSSVFYAVPMKSIASSCHVGTKCVAWTAAQIYHGVQFANANAHLYESIEDDTEDVHWTI